MPRVWKFGDDVDTDQIVPGRYAPILTGDDDVSKYCFVERRPEFAKSVQPGDIIVAGRNFGCGSSREYAVSAIKQCGIAAIIAASVARIFFRNCVNLGIPIFEDAQVPQALADGDEAVFDMSTGSIICQGQTYHLRPPEPFIQAIVRAGGIVPYYLQHRCFPTGE